MLYLMAGLVMFIGAHLLGVFPEFRNTLRQQAGEAQFKLIYTGISLAGFGLIIFGMGQADRDMMIWTAPAWGRDVALFAVPVSMILLVASFAPGHIRHTVGHPMLAGVTVWAGAHLLANSTLPSVVLFASFLVWSIISFISHSLRDTPPPVVKGWGGDLTAIIVGFLIAMVIMRYHAVLFGVAIF
ncbi:MAG: NnrU family protein [Maricaulis sp.]|jgi:uncharacterized membrane protein|nr:NnrU family protein [Maricaulis sp.]MDG2043771.1 NnrU family protein [Maricaulis sp.]